MSSLYGFQPSSVFPICSHASNGDFMTVDLQVCMGPRTSGLWFWANITACINKTNKNTSYCSSAKFYSFYLMVLCMQNSDFRLTCITSFSLSPSISSKWGFCLQISRLLDQNCMSLMGPRTSSVIFCMQNSHCLSIRNTSLYVSQSSSVVFECKTATFWTRITSL